MTPEERKRLREVVDEDLRRVRERKPRIAIFNLRTGKLVNPQDLTAQQLRMISGHQ